MADEQTKQAFDSYIKWLLEDLWTSIAYRKADDDWTKQILLWKLTGEDVSDCKDLDEWFRKHWECLEVNTFKQERRDDKIIDVLIACWWPLIRLRLESRRYSAELNYYRGWENYKFDDFTSDERGLLFSLFDLEY
jgi:hypothetical protein